jgi:hypothetical protein
MCTAGSVAMLLNESYYTIKRLFSYEEDYPFPPPYASRLRVPCMEEICLTVLTKFKVCLVPFPKDLYCYPGIDADPYPVWSGDDNFKRILKMGHGLIEGLCGDIGHLCAWDSKKIYDPRGHIYVYNDAHMFNFEPTRFWLKVKSESPF